MTGSLCDLSCAQGSLRLLFGGKGAEFVDCPRPHAPKGPGEPPGRPSARPASAAEAGTEIVQFASQIDHLRPQDGDLGPEAPKCVAVVGDRADPVG